MIGESIAGTVDYAAPEQMGKREGVAPGPYSDVYGWAKTCCYALFQTTQPLMKHWTSVPAALAELLEKCLDEDPKRRPQGFADVLASLDKMTKTSAAVTAAPRPARPEIRYTETPAKPPKRRAPVAAPERPAWMLPLIIGGGVVLVFLVCGGGLILLVANRTPTPVANNAMQPPPLPVIPPFTNNPKPPPVVSIIPPVAAPPPREATPAVAPDDAAGQIALLESQPPFRPHFVAAMDALVKLKDEKGAEAIANYLADPFHGEDAARGLREMGPIAEKTVAAYVNNKDARVRERVAALLRLYKTKSDVLIPVNTR